MDMFTIVISIFFSTFFAVVVGFYTAMKIQIGLMKKLSQESKE